MDSEIENVLSLQSKKKTIRVVCGTILDVINAFRRNELEIKDLEALLIDELDFLVSFGQMNNLKRLTQFIKFKNPNFFKEKNTLLTVKEDFLDEIKEFKHLLGEKEKFVNIRLKIDFDGEIKKLENEEMDIEQSGTGIKKAVFNQFFYIEEKVNLYSLLFILVKFEIFTGKFLFIGDTVEDAYRIKLFLERSSLTNKAVVFNPKHPISLKRYRLSLLNSNQARFLCAPKSFLEEFNQLKNTKLKMVRNLVFVTTNLTYNEYQSF